MATTENTVLQFSQSSNTLSAKVHPLVIFNICDCYVRRPDQADRVIGTLLGSVLPDGTVDIRNSYAVPHNEFSDQVSSLLCIELISSVSFMQLFGHPLIFGVLIGFWVIIKTLVSFLFIDDLFLTLFRCGNLGYLLSFFSLFQFGFFDYIVLSVKFLNDSCKLLIRGELWTF